MAGKPIPHCHVPAERSAVSVNLSGGRVVRTTTVLSGRIVASLLVALLGFGCAADQQPPPTFDSGTRIGIVNGLESHLTHQHIGIRNANSFTRTISVDWNIPSFIDATLENSLQRQGRFVVVPLRSPAIRAQLNPLADQVYSATTRRRMSESLVNFVEDMARAHDLNALIIVQSFEGESPWRIYDSPIVVKGYGLLTRQTGLGAVGIRSNWVHPYAQILVTVFSTNPVAIIGSGRPSLSTRRMTNFEWPADIGNIPRAQVDELRPRIRAYADQAMMNALRTANFVATEAERRYARLIESR